LSVYADSSFFVSLYLADAHAAEVQRRVNQRQRIWLTPLHRAEWHHAIAQHVFRGLSSEQEAAQVYSAFEADRKSRLWQEAGIPDAVYETAVALAKKHCPSLGTRTLDTLHIASALELGATKFWTFDQRQERLAKAAGLSTS
jgi:predicted nucleic acid-binding protein